MQARGVRYSTLTIAHKAKIVAIVGKGRFAILGAESKCKSGFYKGAATGVYDEELLRILRDFMGWENYDERIRDDDRIDLEVLEDIRQKHALWLKQHGHAR